MGRIILKVAYLFLFSLLRNTFKPTKPSIYQTLVQVLHFDQHFGDGGGHVSMGRGEGGTLALPYFGYYP